MICEWCDQRQASNELHHRELGVLQVCSHCYCEWADPDIDFLAKQRADPVPGDHAAWTRTARSSHGEHWTPKTRAKRHRAR